MDLGLRVKANILLSTEVLGFPGGSDHKESACSAGDAGLIPGSGRSPGEGNGNPLQYSCLENPIDRGAWQATVHGFTKSWTRRNDEHLTSPGTDIVTISRMRKPTWKIKWLPQVTQPAKNGGLWTQACLTPQPMRTQHPEIWSCCSGVLHTPQAPKPFLPE